MEIKNLSKFSNAEKIVLAEQLWDSVSKNELDIRLKNFEEGNSEFYSWDEVKAHLKFIR